MFTANLKRTEIIDIFVFKHKYLISKIFDSLKFEKNDSRFCTKALSRIHTSNSLLVKSLNLTQSRPSRDARIET